MTSSLLTLKGRRVMHDETRKEGVIIVEPRNKATSVYVLFDGAEQPVPCHPSSLELLETAA